MYHVNHGEFMPSIRHIIFSALTVALLSAITDTFGTTPDLQSETHSVLKKAAEEVQVELSLGQLAAHRASNEQVQEFAQQMVEDHKKASQQIELLAVKHGVQLSSGHRDPHRNTLDKKLEELSTLSGHAFDREYMDYSIRDHELTIEEFRRRARGMPAPDIKQWILLVLPILEGHREKAHRVKYALQTNP